MSLVKFELKKVFSNKLFLIMLAFTLFLNLFSLYEIKKSNSGISAEMTYSSYDEFLDSVQANAEASLSVSIFNDELTDFSKKNIEKTSKDFEKMRGIEISADKNDGIMLVFKSGISDLCILMLLVSVGLSLISDEKDKRLFHLIRSTKNGTVKTFFSKLLALLICCVVVNTLVVGSTIGFAYFSYGFGNVLRSVQSVPELLTSFLRLNIAEFFTLYYAAKTVGLFIIGAIVFLCCLVAKRTIIMLVSVTLLGASSTALTLIPSTSSINFFKFINLNSLINPLPVLSSYTNLNLFGEPINILGIFAVFAILTAITVISLSTAYFVNKRPLENSEKRASYSLSANRVHGSITHFELKKLLGINKVGVIVLIFALLQTYAVFNQSNFQSRDEYHYKYYMEMLGGPLTKDKEQIILTEKAKLDEANEKMNALNVQIRNREISMQEFISAQEQYSQIIEKSDVFDRVYDRYLYVKENPEAEFIYDSGYEKIFGLDGMNLSAENTILLLFVLSLVSCSIYSTDYKNEMYKILCATKYGVNKTRRIKGAVLLCVFAVVFVIAYLPELIYIGRFYGFDGISSEMLCIPDLAHFGRLPMWVGIVILYLLRFAIMLLLLPIVSALSLKSRNNVVTALVSVSVFVLPICVYYLFKVGLFGKISLWNLISGCVLTKAISLPLFLIQLSALVLISILCSVLVKRKFGNAS